MSPEIMPLLSENWTDAVFNVMQSLSPNSFFPLQQNEVTLKVDITPSCDLTTPTNLKMSATLEKIPK
jgi:hypothetical protein